ncbi:hypothetical protein L208DRAFT_59209 [Tricholoma matsutake]|nr:hypothetical protein L208DRAFT_59209 [Tricholoma matsutake 945]
MQHLTRDSVLYFFKIFWVYLANLIIWLNNRITLNELGIPLFFALPNILVNRLLISMRSLHHRSSSEAGTECDVPTVRFRPPTAIDRRVRDHNLNTTELQLPVNCQSSELDYDMHTISRC